MKRIGILLMMIFTMSLLGCTGRVIIITTTTQTSTLEEERCSFNIRIDISNGVDQIETEFVSVLAYGTGNDEFTADGIAATYNMVDHISDFSTIDQTESLEFVKDFSITVTRIEVFDLQGNLLSTLDTVNEISDLDTGQYIVRLTSNNNESTCNISGHNYFILNIE